MKSVEVERNIEAPAAVVWSIISDADLLQNSNSGILEISNPIADGARFKLRSALDPKRSFFLRVTVFKPESSMEWSGGMPFGLFTGRRRFTLTPARTGTHLKIKETFSGPLAGLIWVNMPDLTPSFEQLADAIKDLSERHQT